ncbi:MAG: hypothetical protein NTW86_24240, partial [Candidatus Sumerlaeota bacterium]|nr:hypothetical protein [Candidatus Sumerlaeota bacterium]
MMRFHSGRLKAALILGLALLLNSAVCSPAQAASSSLPIVVGERAHPAEHLAARELADALQKLYPAEKFEIKTYESGFVPKSGKMILLGTPESLPHWNRNDAIDRIGGGPESFLVDSFIVNTPREGQYQVGRIAGADPRGVAYGVYALLEKLGCGFYFSYDAIPEKSREFSFDQWNLADAPLVPDRVVFDWHNFLSGCSTWSLEHWEKWIVQSQKMGYNAVMVHAYGNNPMVEFEYGGQTKPVGYLSTTRSGRDWSTQHVNDVRRLWGGQVFDGPVFGSAAAMVPDERRVEAAQKMMHDAFECARQRAMGVYFAFDIETFQANPQNLILTLPERARFLVPSNSGPDKLWLADPDTPEGFDYYKGQVAALLKNYPQITTLVCWFRWGAGTPWMRMALENMPPGWQAEYRAEIAKTPEAAKLELPAGCFALSKAVRAYARALKELGRPDIRVATGTWRFLFYPACDRFMPRDVMFIGLDTEVLRHNTCFDSPTQRAEQAAVGAHRPIVPVAWAHHDDGAYLGRPFTPYANFFDKLSEMKASGYGIIHWTTRPLDLYFKSLVRQVWQST